MISTVINILLKIPQKSRKRILWGLLFFVVVAVLLYVMVFSDSGTDNNQTKEVANHIQHEVNRTERIINLIDERKEAELDALKKNRSESDDVLSTLDSLLGFHSGK